MLKNLICFIGLCSVIHAANIDIVEAQVGRQALIPSLYTVGLSGTEKTLDEFKNQLDEISTHLFIGLDGKVTCFVPSDAQLENREKFPSEYEAVRKMRDNIRSLNISDDRPALIYYQLADYLTMTPYATQLCISDHQYTDGLNIMLQRRSLENCDIMCDVRRGDHSAPEIYQEMSDLQNDTEALIAYKINFLKNGYMTGYNVKLYTDDQMKTTCMLLDSATSCIGAITSEVRIKSISHPNDFYALSCFFWPQLLRIMPYPEFYKPWAIDEVRD